MDLGEALKGEAHDCWTTTAARCSSRCRDAGRPVRHGDASFRHRHPRQTGDVLQGRRAHPPGEMPGVSSAELDRADVAHQVRRGAALGEVDPRPRRDASDAAVAHRSQRRRAEVQERHVAERRPGGDDRPLGRSGRAAGRPERPAAPQAARDRQRVEGRARRLRSAGPRREVIRVHDAGAAPGRLVPADERHPSRRITMGETTIPRQSTPERPAVRIGSAATISSIAVRS